ncbi:hydroxymethylpyrimidine/phosphomethylpyrimidine kinase [Siphonobacter sp. BAB-5405]|uniref:hydroxymethylpyrimidine/phosphomethylpyrimidine kinase n=1 Tax=Siphonobacter sp. BAB-5405 TaxID=1864825 RepID=UPI000C7FE780|nr:hydroxymethylpyrimidine/phosphomethylpyrimidine kinase [Siphonobacter sp. BAB-5405]PMD97497.1 hydroxymethylpyrimidine/phosphomethylpyrimidine kinase [Siphonobacter sp. BAB-5405]
MIQTERPYVLSIAGLDPSAGAGILADVKVFELNQVYGLSVCTALTMQHDADFRALEWVPLPTILNQCQPLFERYPIEIVKVGLIESFAVLDQLTDWLLQQNPGIQIIWDPILKASAGFTFHAESPYVAFESVLRRLRILTPNAWEAQQLTGIDSPLEAAKVLSQYCLVYLKGGHVEPVEETVTDYFLREGEVLAAYPAPHLPQGEKHGSGCVLSSALAAGLAKGQSISETGRSTRQYMNRYLASTPYLLGFHTL